MSVEDDAKAVLDKLGLHWPDGDPDKLRQAATAWRTFAGRVDDVRTPVDHAAKTLIHRAEDGLKGILQSKKTWKAEGPVHARHGDSQYFTDISPHSIKGLKKTDLSPRDIQAGGISHYQLVGRLFGRPTRWGLGKTTHYIAVDTTDLGRGIAVDFKTSERDTGSGDANLPFPWDAAITAFPRSWK